MPRIAQSQIDRTRLGPATTAAAAPVPAPPLPADVPTVSCFMVSPLPAIAGGSDQLARQFYGRHALPTQRVLPIR